MIKLIIFDLDGVLVEARDIHYMALNDALHKMDKCYTINKEEHLSSYDGLPTSKKLMKLSKEKGLPVSFHKYVWGEKQKSTELVISEMVKPENHTKLQKQPQGPTIHNITSKLGNSRKNINLFFGSVNCTEFSQL